MSFPHFLTLRIAPSPLAPLATLAHSAHDVQLKSSNTTAMTSAGRPASYFAMHLDVEPKNVTSAITRFVESNRIAPRSSRTSSMKLLPVVQRIIALRKYVKRECTIIGQWRATRRLGTTELPREKFAANEIDTCRENLSRIRAVTSYVHASRISRVDASPNSRSFRRVHTRYAYTRHRTHYSREHRRGTRSVIVARRWR